MKTLKDFVTDNLSLFNNLEHTISGEELRAFLPTLRLLKEFKDVKEIHVPDHGSYVGDEATEKPIVGDNSELKPGQTHVKSVTYKYDPRIQFSDVVNLVSIGISPPLYRPADFDNLGEGAWILPFIYNPDDTAPTKQIRFNFNIEKLQGNEEYKKELMAKFEAALTAEPNVPCYHHIFLRVSPKSVIQLKEEDTLVTSKASMFLSSVPNV